MDPLSIPALQNYLQGIDFPADKEEVASAAENNDAPHEIVEKIRNAHREASTIVIRFFRQCGAPCRGAGENFAPGS